MKISIASDHGGFLLKEELKDYLTSLGHEIVDCGTSSLESCDYPDFAQKAARLVADGTCERGIEVCTTGEGVCICAKIRIKTYEKHDIKRNYCCLRRNLLRR